MFELAQFISALYGIFAHGCIVMFEHTSTDLFVIADFVVVEKMTKLDITLLMAVDVFL